MNTVAILLHPALIVIAAVLAGMAPYVVRRMSQRHHAVVIGDAGTFQSFGRKTMMLHAVVSAGLVFALAFSVCAAQFDQRTAVSDFVPSGTNGVVVIDLSGSVGGKKYEEIGVVFRTLSSAGEEEKKHFGVVFFSDTAYEALPPDTNAEALRSFIPFFSGESVPDSSVRTETRNPWGEFTRGTNISYGLRKAYESLSDAGYARGTIILVSDLRDGSEDFSRLEHMLAMIKEDGRYALRIVGLSPSPADEILYREKFGSEAFVLDTDTLKSVEAGTQLFRGQRYPAPGFLWQIAFFTVLLAASFVVIGPPLLSGRRQELSKKRRLS